MGGWSHDRGMLQYCNLHHRYLLAGNLTGALMALAQEPSRTLGQDHAKVIIFGAGFAGLGMAVRLKQQGEEDFLILERADDVGGTWHYNTYPGCRCDVPSHLYSFSFAPNPDWSRTFSPQPEIWEYLRRVSAEHGVDPHIRYRHEVIAARWDEQAEL